MDALFGIAGPDFVIMCANKTHASSIVKVTVRNPFSFVISPCCRL